MAYIIQLKQFEGPLDLLLHLISRAQIDICDIFISEITEQYLAAMGDVASLDMDTASEFLAMAATLLEIKSRALLPRPPEPEEEGEETPEQALIRRPVSYTHLDVYKRQVNHASPQLLYAVFGNTMDPQRGKPTNSELIAMLAERVRLQSQNAGCADAQSTIG